MVRSVHRVARAARRGYSFMELLIACIILSIGAIGAVGIVGVLTRTPATKRLTEMGAFIASQEMERVKTQTYNYLGTESISPDYYDKYGKFIASGAGPTPAGSLYKAAFTVTVKVDRDGVANAEDVKEITITVTNVVTNKQLEQMQTLMAFGGE